MKKLKIWHIAAVFFAVCAGINLYGCWTDNAALANTIKPALMPLLCLSSIAALAHKSGIKSREAKLLAFAQLFGFAGDTALIGSEKFVFFAAGIGLFLIGHIFYITLFGGKSWKGLKFWYWLIAIIISLGAVALLIINIGIKGALMAPMAVYGFTLMMLIFSTLAGVIRFGGKTWWILLVGACLFTFSDSLIAIHTFKNPDACLGRFGVMSTYLAAQVLLAIGGVRLAKNKK